MNLELIWHVHPNLDLILVVEESDDDEAHEDRAHWLLKAQGIEYRLMVPIKHAVALTQGREPDKVIAEFVPECCVADQEALENLVVAMQGRFQVKMLNECVTKPEELAKEGETEVE
jgi:hypothetical protein